jgi:hypothetical protein
MSLERLTVLIDALCVAEKVDQIEECWPPGSVENERRFPSTPVGNILDVPRRRACPSMAAI